MHAFLGIDWGTDSSKWCFQDSRRGSPLFGDIWSSIVWREGDDLCLYPFANEHRGDARFVGALKQAVINYPGVPVWQGEWEPLQVTLGESMVFSIASLLFDARAGVKEKLDGIARGLLDSRELTVRFSYPNWLDQSRMPALRSFRDACVVALNLYSSSVLQPRKDGAIRVTRAQLKQFVEMYLSSTKGLGDSLTGMVEDVRWELVFESCAAGFPYLVEKEEDIFDTGISKRGEEGAGAVRKILVIDIGAGSTDICYLVRTRPPKLERPVLVWLPAAPSFSKAGNELTAMILDRWRSAGHSRALGDAEAYKITSREWHGEQYCSDWCKEIARRAMDYPAQIDNPLHLNKNPAMEIVMTGGSSVVPPLKGHVLGTPEDFGVKRALTLNGVMPGRADKTEFIPAHLTRLKDYNYAEVEVAKLAVCLGASDPYFVHLKPVPSF